MTGREGNKHLLHTSALGLLTLTISAVFIHLLPHLASAAGSSFALAPWFERWLTLASAAFPALGAALTGIENQGEFTRLAKRSRAMSRNFERFAHQIAQLEGRLGVASEPPVTLGEVTPLADEIAQLMVDEVADWRVVFRDREQTAAA